MVNKVILIGNLGRDPEVRYMEGSRTKTTFTIATSERYKNREGQQITDTVWHNIVLWGGVAEVAGKYLKKGSPVYIEGKIVHRSYDDREGNKRYITEVVGRDMTLLPGRGQEGGAMPVSSPAPAPAAPAATEEKQQEDQLDDLPF